MASGMSVFTMCRVKPVFPPGKLWRVKFIARAVHRITDAGDGIGSSPDSGRQVGRDEQADKLAAEAVALHQHILRRDGIEAAQLLLAQCGGDLW